MRKLFWFKFLVAGMLAVTLGCSKAKPMLDRETAAHEISSRFEGEDNELLVDVGKVGLHCASLNRDGTKMALPVDPEHLTSDVVAQKAGYVTVTRAGKGFWNVILTDKGKAALDRQPKDSLPDYTNRDDRNTLNGCDFHEVPFKIARPALVRVTGVTTDEQAARADFDFKWQTTELGDALRVNGNVYTQLDPLQQAELMTAVFTLTYRVSIPVPPADDTQTGSARFQLHDDGWRIR